MPEKTATLYPSDASRMHNARMRAHQSILFSAIIFSTFVPDSAEKIPTIGFHSVIVSSSINPSILHRDFTPDNLMLENGVIKVVDFNISQSALANSSRTVMGKHCFMAPEQFCGESSVASDLYQLGTTIYYLATGVDPEPLTPCDIHAHRTDLSDSLHDLVRRLTDRDPANRLHSARAVMESVQDMSKGELSKKNYMMMPSQLQAHQMHSRRSNYAAIF